jgi:probable sporulation protein (polysaccharide deacetylase family)
MAGGEVMQRYKKYVNLVLFVLIVFLAFRLDPYPFANDAVSVAREKNDALYEEIVEKANNKSYDEEPIDAKIDPVWKKTPGRNGKKINIERSYQNMKKGRVFKEDLLAFDQIKPNINIEDLPASPIYRGHPEKQMVTFMINVSWGEEHIPDILNTLQEHQVKANFFIEGKWAREHTELVKMIQEKGHLIGNHAYNHPDMQRLNRAEIYEQITQTNEILTAITGKTPQFFTPPSGSYKDEVVDVAAEEKMETILWSTDTIDWKNPSVSVMINRVRNNVHPGAIILMHPTPVINEGMDDLIQLLKEQNFRIGRLDTLLSTDR